MATSDTFHLTLTQEQRDQIRTTGKEAEAIELTVEELEERMAPMRPRPAKLL